MNLWRRDILQWRLLGPLIAVLTVLAFLGVSMLRAQNTEALSKRPHNKVKVNAGVVAPLKQAVGEIPSVSLQNKSAMRITLKTSRNQSTEGSSFGITAEIENTSDQPIYTMPAAIAITVPPELTKGAVYDLWAFIPGLTALPKEDYWGKVVVLEPGSSISAVWSSSNASSSASSGTATTSWIERGCDRLGVGCGKFVQGIEFSPGVYTLNVVGSYWDTYLGAQKKIVERHTQTAEIQEMITAPQSVILFGAALGGVIAFLLLTKLQPSGNSGWASVGWVTGSVSAVLLSTIVTILIARLSQSQFIISVTVNDFWGAIAVGFIITAAGPAILRKFTGIVSTSSTNSPVAVSAPSTDSSATTKPSQDS
ncbi:MAG: hypothetical protein WB780_01715 [Candidatus Acidiferrales bacterium]